MEIIELITSINYASGCGKGSGSGRIQALNRPFARDIVDARLNFGPRRSHHPRELPARGVRSAPSSEHAARFCVGCLCFDGSPVAPVLSEG